jgi:5-deoxy-glucuronate isomerase
MSKTNGQTLLRSRVMDPARSGALIATSPERAGWERVSFAVRQLAAGTVWASRTGGQETCLVLLEGTASVSWTPGPKRAARLGPRRDVFSDYPHAVYLPPGTRFEVQAKRRVEIAVCQSPTDQQHPARVIRPEDCGLEIRGGGNATRQIVDILPPTAAADRLLVCEVYTPAGNWSSFPPHKHDVHNPPVEADLEETYYYRFRAPEAFGVQKLYTADRRTDETLTVRHGDLVLVRDGYHPFVAAYGYDAYYLNTLAGSFRSMAAPDDPQYAHLRSAWPPADPRVPLIAHPRHGRTPHPAA